MLASNTLVAIFLIQFSSASPLDPISTFSCRDGSFAVLPSLIATIQSHLDLSAAPGSALNGLVTSLPISQSGWISASTYNTLIDCWYVDERNNQPHLGHSARVSEEPQKVTTPAQTPRLINSALAHQIASSIFTQSGPANDFSGAISPGNDDQLWWGLTCVSAEDASLFMPAAASNANQNWLGLAEKVFHSVISRWQANMCDSSSTSPSAQGGLSWQISPAVDGYRYKNAITNGLAFQLAARLAHLTNRKQYREWANKLWKSNFGVGNLIDSNTYKVFDGVQAPACQVPADEEWSYNVGVWMGGCSAMYQDYLTNGPRRTSSFPNFDEMISGDEWKGHAMKLLNSAVRTFTRGNVLYEARCENQGTCNADQQMFKAALARSMGLTAKYVPGAVAKVKEVLNASGRAAVGDAGADVKIASGIGGQLAVVETLVQGMVLSKHV